MSTEVLYRKWRPRTFAELAGQEAVVRTLTNALASGKVSHAYLLSGPRGTGKTTTGRLLAKALNCAKPKKGEPCNKCDSCLSYMEGRALDLIELAAASNRGIDEIRNLRDKASFAPTPGRAAHTLYLVDADTTRPEPAFHPLPTPPPERRPPAAAGRQAPAPSRTGSRSAPDAGGGRTPSSRGAACTNRLPDPKTETTGPRRVTVALSLPTHTGMEKR